jgi:hypothetical protein
MKRLLFVLVLVVVGIIGLGFYQGWFHVGSDKADGKSNLTLSVDTDKFQEDRKSAVAGVQNLGHKAEDKVAGKSHDGKSHDGKVVSISGAKLVMTNMEGEEEHRHALAADVKITCDGKICNAADLKPGMRVRVTTENAEPRAATRIEALDNNRDFEKGA